MPHKLIQNLKQQGKLRIFKAAFAQIESLLKESILDLEEARCTLKIAKRATYLMAYNAMLKAGRALLLLEGYAPLDGSQHKTVVDVANVILGKDYEELVMHFETMRRKRNELTYEAGTLISEKESLEAFSDALALVECILKIVKSKNPQMEIKWE